jgi:hypothetical protein
VRATHTAALSRAQSPEFVTLYRWERVRLRMLSWVARLLYEELVSLSSFKTGEVATSYAQLVTLLTPDQPAHGRRLPAPTLKQVRSAMDELQAVELVARNQALNEAAGKLLLQVENRKSAAARNANLGRDEGRVEKAKKFWKDNKLERAVHRKRAGVRAGGAEGSSISIPQPQIFEELSTGQGPTPPEPDEPPGAISLAPRGGKIGPPRGPDTRPAGAGHAPRATPTTQAMRERLRNAASAPPGGQEDAPPGEAPPPSARIRRPRTTVLKDEAAESGKASAPAGPGAEPTGGP